MTGEPGQRRRPAHARVLDLDQRDEQLLQAGVGPAVLLAQFGERALGDQTSRGDDADPVGHALGDFEDMRGHDHGAAGAHALREQSLDMPRRDGIEPGERLVQDDQPRVVDQGARERHLLAHALGEALAALVQMRLEAERDQELLRRTRRTCAGSMPQRPATNSRYSSGVSLS